MNKVLRTDTNGAKIFHCPGCGFYHVLDKRWTITGGDETPTAKPSLLNTQPWKEDGLRCHLFVTNGQIIYLSDCTHSLAGQTVDMREEL